MYLFEKLSVEKQIIVGQHANLGNIQTIVPPKRFLEQDSGCRIGTVVPLTRNLLLWLEPGVRYFAVLGLEHSGQNVLSWSVPNIVAMHFTDPVREAFLDQVTVTSSNVLPHAKTPSFVTKSVQLKSAAEAPQYLTTVDTEDMIWLIRQFNMDIISVQAHSSAVCVPESYPIYPYEKYANRELDIFDGLEMAFCTVL